MKFKTHPNILVFFSILIFSFLLYNLTLAQTLTPTESLILQLQEQVKTLQEQLKTLQSEVKTAKTELELVKTELKFTKALSRGATGDEVKQLQKFLKQFSDIYPQGLVTGYFGPFTEAAVRKFQEKQGIESIGVVGPRTITKLNELVTEGAGASGIVPPGPLIAPGIQKKLEIPATTTTPIATTPIPIQPATIVPTGICLIKDRYTDIPRFDIADFGNGFGKYAVIGVNTVPGLQTACTKTIYDYLIQNYCKTNAIPVQRLITTYDARGTAEAKNLVCGSQGCDFIGCSSVASLAPISTPTTTPSGTIPATPAISATPAQPVSVTGTSTVSAVSATPATPAQPAAAATTTTTTTDTTSPSVTLTGPDPGFANSNCTVQLGYVVSDDSGTVILQQKVNGINYGSEISNSTIPNGSITGGGCQNLANGTHTYTVVARDAAGNTTTKNLTFSLPLTATVAPLAISSLSATNITSNSATITWTTNQSAFSYVRYSTVPNYVYWDKSDSVLVTSHSISLTGLSSATTYYYWVSSNNSGGNVNADMQTFITTAETTSTATAPDIYPTGFSATVSGSTVSLSWSSVTNATYYKIDRQQTGTSAWSTISNTSTVFTSWSDSPGYGGFTYRIYPCNTVGCSSLSNVLTVSIADSSNATTTLNYRSQNLSAISQMIDSLDEILKQLSQILK